MLVGVHAAALFVLTSHLLRNPHLNALVHRGRFIARPITPSSSAAGVSASMIVWFVCNIPCLRVAKTLASTSARKPFWTNRMRRSTSASLQRWSSRSFVLFRILWVRHTSWTFISDARLCYGATRSTRGVSAVLPLLATTARYGAQRRRALPFRPHRGAARMRASQQLGQLDLLVARDRRERQGRLAASNGKQGSDAASAIASLAEPLAAVGSASCTSARGAVATSRALRAPRPCMLSRAVAALARSTTIS